MKQSAGTDVSPYLAFSKEKWARLRADTPLTLSAADLAGLQGLNQPVSMDEVIQIYLPLSRLLNLYVSTTQQLFAATQAFLGAGNRKVPYIVGLAGSVAAGKSTTARILQALLARWPNHPKVDLVATDGFLLPNAVLEAEGLMERKGFAESYDRPALLRFLSEIKAGRGAVAAPVYSHIAYDVLEGETITVDRPDILILEGLNVLQTGKPPRDGKAIPYVSDFFDFSIYLDADNDDLRNWYVSRFLQLQKTAFRDPAAYFHRYATLDEREAREVATRIWTDINLKNLTENILPTRQRADLILAKAANHAIEHVYLRKI